MTAPAPTAESSAAATKATNVIVIGMAGSGKTAFTSKLVEHISSTGGTPYAINLDPAVTTLGYQPNVDIRDTIDYARVMEEYNLGPNGGILTALNLFTTKFDQVLGIVERRSTDVSHVVLDTPGQIEIFTWSASGSIITDALASTMPTCVAYVVDTPRTRAPATFMSNMLYACSIMYKTKLPFVLVFNKTDLQPCEFALDWMQDFESFQSALKGGDPTEPFIPSESTRPEGEGSYMNSLMSSMSLVLEEFYNQIRAVGVSSLTGAGFDGLIDAFGEARKEYEEEYAPELARKVKEREENREKSKKEQLDRLMRDMNVDDAPRRQAAAHAERTRTVPRRATQNRKAAASTSGLEEDEDVGDGDLEPAYEGDGQIIDPDSDEDRPDPEVSLFGSALRGNDALSGVGPGTSAPGRTYGLDGTVWPSAR